MIINYVAFNYDDVRDIVNVRLQDIGEYEIMSSDQELMKKDKINIHDLKYYDFHISDMNVYDYALSSRNQVTISIRFLSKLGIDNKKLASIIATDVGEDFYRFLINIKNMDIGYELIDVTKECKAFLDNLDGFRLIDNNILNGEHEKISQGVYKYLGDFLHHVNEEIIRDRIAAVDNDRRDFDIVTKITSLMELDADAFKNIDFSPIVFSNNERLLMKQYNNIEIAKRIIDELPSELNLGLVPDNSYGAIDVRDTMLIRLLRLHYGSVNVSFKGYFNTNDIKFKLPSTNQHIYGMKGIKSIIQAAYPEADTSEIFDKFLSHEYNINYCNCHDFIVIIKALNYGFLHNLLGMRYVLLPNIVIKESSSDKAFRTHIMITTSNKSMVIKPDKIEFEGFNFDIEEYYYVDDNNNDIFVDETLANF